MLVMHVITNAYIVARPPVHSKIGDEKRENETATIYSIQYTELCVQDKVLCHANNSNYTQAVNGVC